MPVTRTRQAGHFYTARAGSSYDRKGGIRETLVLLRQGRTHGSPSQGQSGGGLDWVPPGIT